MRILGETWLRNRRVTPLSFTFRAGLRSWSLANVDLCKLEVHLVRYAEATVPDLVG